MALDRSGRCVGLAWSVADPEPQATRRRLTARGRMSALPRAITAPSRAVYARPQIGPLEGHDARWFPPVPAGPATRHAPTRAEGRRIAGILGPAPGWRNLGQTRQA